MATYEDIKKANEEAKTSPIKGKPYIEVNERIKAFRKVYAEGFIDNSMIFNENGICVFRSEVGFYSETGERRILGTGTAYEKEDSSFINKTSYIENCETSACGRALGMAGFGIDTSVASFEEVANAIEQQDAYPDKKKMLQIVEKHYPKDSEALQKLLECFKADSIDKLTDDQLKAVYAKHGGK